MHFFNILNDDSKICASSIYFTKIFDIIFQDLLNILKSDILFLNIKNEQIKNYIFNLEQQGNCEQKILTFIKITNEIKIKILPLIAQKTLINMFTLYQL